MNPASTAATEPQRKRARFAEDDDASTTQTTKATSSARKTLPPKSIAIDLISQHCETLQPKLADMLRKAGISHINAMIKEHNKLIQIAKLKNDENFFPNSISLQFELKATKEIKEDPEFTALDEKAHKVILTYKKEMRKVILATAQLEQKKVHDMMRDDLCRAYRLLVEAFMVHENSKENVDATVFHAITTNSIELLSPFDMSKQAFVLRYTAVHGLTEFPPMTHPPSVSTHFARPADVQPVITTTSYDYNSCVESLKAVLSTPWVRYQQSWAEKEADLRLAKFAAEHITAQATADAAEVADNEKSVDPERLVELIEKGIAKRTKHLEKEVNQLRQQLTHNNTQRNGKNQNQKQQPQKNSVTRGRSKSPRAKKQGAQGSNGNEKNSKSTRNPQTRSKSPRRNPSAKAVGSNSGTNKGAPKKNPKKGDAKKKSGKRSNSNERSRSSNRSTRRST
jgi:hypothetical protein